MKFAPRIVLLLWSIVAILELTRNLPQNVYLSVELMWIVTLIATLLVHNQLSSLRTTDKVIVIGVLAFIVVGSFALAITITITITNDFLEGVMEGASLHAKAFVVAVFGGLFSSLMVSLPIYVIFPKNYLLIGFLCCLPINLIQGEALLSFDTSMQFVYAFEIAFRVLSIWLTCLLLSKALTIRSTRTLADARAG